MRCWHKDLIPLLPKKQLMGQWRECCLIAKSISEKGTPNHILVNRIMDYPIEHFYIYGLLIAKEMFNRGYRVDYMKFTKYFPNVSPMTNINIDNMLFCNWHNERYLKQCLYNLQEKFDSNGISKNEWDKIIEKFGDKYDL